ncbi:unnamed protein product [Vitrella brassicaformis CCMP3155]|uniref:Uncharacterized protein n=3 Tax=Vitrella brassicaformis TaxID=1169539 RepID=A0A0G4EL13_VITBC|nr:unnamed protein product [Vitrella brassicaformis CCMP3155]|eukprot:CEL97871.1 unnamed protein product [Vitrella brassicaformis CCMP3155]
MLAWLPAAVLVILLGQWERRGAVAQFTTACLTGNTRETDDGRPTETNADCQAVVIPGEDGDEIFYSSCEANALLPIVDNPDLGNFGQCFYEDIAQEDLKEQQEYALNNEDSDTFGNVTATSGNQSIICGEPSGVTGTNITDLGTAALGSCPSDKPICARTSDSRFCYCIEEEVGLFGDVASFSRGDVSLVLGVASGQPSSLCFPAELDPCFNAVNRFAVPFDCAGSLPVVERREDIGPDPRQQRLLPNDPPTDPQEATFAQLVPGTYLFEDVRSGAYLPTIDNVGTGNVPSCMRIQGKKNDSNGLDDFFLDLSCNTTEGVSVTLQFTCPETGLCSNRAGNALQPAVATIQGVLQVEQASNPACEGIEAQIEVALTGFVDESESLIAQQFEYNQTQRILIFGNEEQDDLVTARLIGILSPAANTSLGLLTFPDDVPDECDALLNQRVFTVTSGQTEAGGIIGLAASGFGRDVESGNTIRKRPLELNEDAKANRTAFLDCSNFCVRAEQSRDDDEAVGNRDTEDSELVFLGKDLGRALLGEVLPTIFFPIYEPGKSPDLSFSSFFLGDSFFASTTLDTTVCSGDDRFDGLPLPALALCTKALPEAPRSFELFDTETGTQLDFIIKGQLGKLIDGRQVLTNCRGQRLQDLPVGVDPGGGSPFLFNQISGRGIGETVGIALAPDAGDLGGNTCVTTRQRGDKRRLHSCMGIMEDREQSVNVSILLRPGNGSETAGCSGGGGRNLTDQIMEEADICFIGYTCFEACPQVNLTTTPPTAQPSSYLLTDRLSETTNGANVSYCLELIDEDFRALFTCDPDEEDPDEEGVGLQVRIRYDVAELDGRVVNIIDNTTGELATVDVANVDFKGAVRQVLPEECNGTLMFVEGTLVGGLVFQLSPDEEPLNGKYLPTVTRFPAVPEILWTSTASPGEMEYVMVQGLYPSSEDIPKECFDLTQKLTYRKRAFVLEDGNPKPRTSIPLVEVAESEAESDKMDVDTFGWFRVYEEQSEGGREQRNFRSRIEGTLWEVCGIQKIDSTAVQIQCLPREPFKVTADAPGIELTQKQLNSTAEVVTNDGTTLKLESPVDFLTCSCNDRERIKNETNGGDGFIVRTVPLFVDIDPKVEGEEVKQLCPVLIDCKPPTDGDASCKPSEMALRRLTVSLLRPRPLHKAIQQGSGGAEQRSRGRG